MIKCIGVGPGDVKYMTNYAVNTVKEAEIISGFQAVLDFMKTIVPEKTVLMPLTYKNQTEVLEDVAREHHAGKRCVVALMGDMHFSGFQLVERVERACGHEVETIPGISSAQILASKARVCFDETSFITFHRRGEIDRFKSHLVQVMKEDRNAIVIPRPWDFMPKDVAKHLLDNGVDPNHQCEVWENLTGSESQWKGKLSDLTGEFSDMSIILIRCLVPVPSYV